VLALYGIAALIFTVGALLALALPAWAAGLITTAAVLVAAGVAALNRQYRKKKNKEEEKTEAKVEKKKLERIEREK